MRNFVLHRDILSVEVTIDKKDIARVLSNAIICYQLDSNHANGCHSCIWP